MGSAAPSQTAAGLAHLFPSLAPADPYPHRSLADLIRRHRRQPRASAASVPAPALYKTPDEILVDAVDDLQRDRSMTATEVDIGAEQKRVKVGSSGRGPPTQVRKVRRVYGPELVFGHLLASGGCDDS